jgi:hypothetical protein
MSEQSRWRNFWNRLFRSQHQSAREKRVIDYIVRRLDDGANLREIVDEEYVRRNASSQEVEEILSKPELVEAAREHLEQDFSSGELDPNRRERREG